jgi:diaminopimelate epimerase
MQACGNDFIVIDDRSAALCGLESAVARRLCQRRLAIGADGLLLLRNSASAGHFGMVFVNADGLIGEMCGNGARCLAAFIRRAGLTHSAFVLDTGAGPVHVQFGAGDSIVLELPPAGPLRSDQRVAWQGKNWSFDAIDVGPPHVVCLVDTLSALEALDVRQLGRIVRNHPLFMPRGCNVNFIAVHDEKLYIRTYERGVEDETLGCGTGAVASVLVARGRLGLPTPQTVVTRSGESLEIHVDHKGADSRLIGNAHFIADGIAAADLLRDLL